MSDFSDFAKEGFADFLAEAGVPITCNGVTKSCVTGSIERFRRTRLTTQLPDAASMADMFVEDFAAFPNFKINDSVVTIDNQNFNVLTIEGDPQDPCVHLILAIARA